MDNTEKTNKLAPMPMRRRVRRPLVDYAAIDEENRRKAEAAGKKAPKTSGQNQMIGDENPHARNRNINPAKLKSKAKQSDHKQ
jgi:hypothetical protein